LITINGATVRGVASDSTSRTISNALSLGSANITFGAMGTGALTFNGDATLTGTSTWSTIRPTTFNGAISGSGFGFTKTNVAIMTLGGTSANTYTGTTTVNVGELDLNKTAGVNAIGGNLTIGTVNVPETVKLLASDQIADTSAVQIDGTSGVLNLNSQSETIVSLADRTGGTGTSGSVQLGTGTLTIAPSAGTTTFSGVISGTGGNLSKSGAGTQKLSGNNTYTGTTTISASGGTLEIANSGSTSSGRISGTSGVTVSSGGTLLLSGDSSFTDRINDSATMTLSGGTLKLSGVSEGTSRSADRSCRHIAFAFRGKHDRNRRRYFVDLGLERDG
jgi:fibronectin-binding autotransporter adhesin